MNQFIKFYHLNLLRDSYSILANFNIHKAPQSLKNKTGIISRDPSESVAPFRIFNVGNNRSIKLLDCIKLIEKILGKKAKKKFLPMQKGDVLKTKSDSKKLKKILTHKFETKFEDGLTNFINWFKIYHKVN